MIYKSTKQKYLDLRNRLSRVQGYIEGVTEYSILRDGERYTNNLEKPLFDTLETFYRKRASYEYAIKTIEKTHPNFNEWLT